jgi:hypothetical protein
MSQQLVDVEMDEVDMQLTESQLAQLEQDTSTLNADPANDRLEDALAVNAVQQQPAANIQPAQPAAIQPAQPAAADADADATGKNESSNGDSTGDEKDEEDEEGVAHPDLAGLMEAGGKLMSRCVSQSQESNDDDYDNDFKIRDEFDKLKSSIWMQKKLDKTTVELEKLVKSHEKTKRDLVKPMKELIELYPDKKQELTLMSGLLADACIHGDLRDAFIESAQVLKTQVKLLEFIQEHMTIIKVGGECLEQKKEEEAAKRSASSTTMEAASTLLDGMSSKKSRKKARK